MSAFTGHSISSTGSTLEQEPIIIKNTAFFPDVNLSDMRDGMRIISDVTDARLKEVTLDALLDINDQLTAWVVKQLVQGYSTLADVPADTLEIDGKSESELLIRYRRAIYHTVDAALVEDYKDMDSTGHADKRADSLEDRQRTARRDAFWAIRAILQHSSKVAGKVPRKIIVGTI